MRDFTDLHESRRDRTLISRFYVYLKPHLSTFLWAFFLLLIGTITGMLLPLASGLAIDQMTNDALTLSQKVGLILIGAVVLLLMSGISTYVSYLQNILLQKVGQKITHTLREDVYNHMNALSIGQLNAVPVGKLVTRATNDPANISDMFTNTLVNVIRAALTLIIITVILLFISPIMTLITMAIIPLMVLAMTIYRATSKKAYRKVRNLQSELNAYLSEHLSGMKVIHVFHQEKKVNDRFKTISSTLRKAIFQEMYTFAVFRPILYLLSMLATLFAIYMGVRSVFEGTLSIGLFISFYVYVGQFFEPIQQISEQLNTFQGSFASAEKIFDVLDTQPDLIDAPDAIELTSFRGKVEFKDVWFAYVPNEWVLKGISFTLMPQQTMALVGATGSGKTTILQLLVRNYAIQKGQILIDGIPIENIKRASLRRHMGQMLQDVFLFSGTIQDNITLHNDSITEKDIHEASRFVALDHVINKHPEGLKYPVKERGKNFSSGERQLISFARALVYKPSFMILDEATATIDSETETIIQSSLEHMMSISTMMIVAHRLSTIQHADTIVVLSKGEIIEQGNHQMLLKQQGHYYHLYQLQYENQTNDSTPHLEE
jgi:ATP-binding cassette subfamily B protein